MTNVPAMRIRYGARVAVAGSSGREVEAAAVAVSESPASAGADPAEGPVEGGTGVAGAAVAVGAAVPRIRWMPTEPVETVRGGSGALPTMPRGPWSVDGGGATAAPATSNVAMPRCVLPCSSPMTVRW